MAFEHYLRSGNKLLRCGYTTGTCAVLAASGAAIFALTGEAPQEVSAVTKKGITVKAPVWAFGRDGEAAWCSVIKDAGDDADVTDGIEVRVFVSLHEEREICIDGGIGVGRVTKPGLDQPVGNAAINSGPREMICKKVREVCDAHGYTGGAQVIVSVPKGEETAKQTFNAMLGVEGGISILGTSGIVEPMSQQALVDTIEVSMRQAATGSKDLILTPGNYGEHFITEEGLDSYGIPVVKCSNFIGEALDIAAAEGFQRVVLVGHAGKLVKTAGSIMNTHSSYADCRSEIFCAHTAISGGSTELCRKLMEAATADACIELLDCAGIRAAVMNSILKEMQRRLDHRSAGAYDVGAMVFSNMYGVLGSTEGASRILERWKRETEANKRKQEE